MQKECWVNQINVEKYFLKLNVSVGFVSAVFKIHQKSQILFLSAVSNFTKFFEIFVKGIFDPFIFDSDCTDNSDLVKNGI